MHDYSYNAYLLTLTPEKGRNLEKMEQKNPSTQHTTNLPSKAPIRILEHNGEEREKGKIIYKTRSKQRKVIWGR